MKVLAQIEIDAVSGGVPAPEVLLEFGLYDDYVRFTGNPLPFYHHGNRSNFRYLIP